MVQPGRRVADFVGQVGPNQSIERGQFKLSESIGGSLGLEGLIGGAAVVGGAIGLVPAAGFVIAVGGIIIGGVYIGAGIDDFIVGNDDFWGWDPTIPPKLPNPLDWFDQTTQALGKFVNQF